MMRRPALLLLLLVAGLVATALPAVAAEAYDVHHVPTVDGATIRVEIMRDTRHDPQPVILTYSPYNNIAGDIAGGRAADDALADQFVRQGYARAVADVLGTRGSTGCWDYGGADETQSGVDLVNFLSGDIPDVDGNHLAWSSGNVAMIGGSYNGTTATMVAARGDDAPGLKAIVPQAAISRWYKYAFENGVRYFLNSFAPTDEGFDTPLAFDFGFGRTVRPNEAEEDPEEFLRTAQSRAAECGSIAHTEEAYSRTPDYDDFWLERDYLTDPSAYRAAVLITHGWQDYNVKQVNATDLWHALPVDDPATTEVDGVPFKVLWVDQQTHGSPGGGEWNTLLEEFFEVTLEGAPLGGTEILRERVEDTPVRTTTRDFDGEAETLYETQWPPVGTEELTLHLGRWFDYDVEGLPQEGLVGSTGETGILSTHSQDTGAWTWVDVGAASELIVENDPLNEPGHGYYSLYYQSPPLAEDVRIAGPATVDAFLRPTNGSGAHFTPVLLDVAPDGAMQVVERGFLNLDYRNGLAEAQPLGAQEWAHATVDMLPQDYTFRAGHRIALLTMSSNDIWAVPGNPAGTVNIANGPVPEVTDVGTTLRLPVVGGADGSVFAEAPPTPPQPTMASMPF